MKLLSDKTSKKVRIKKKKPTSKQKQDFIYGSSDGIIFVII